jgi:hypothetical protein
MVTTEEVQRFLLNFKEKVKIYDVVFRDDRGKNLQTLADLDITPKYRKDIIMKLKVQDYSEGPIIDALNKFGEMWVFGKDVKGQDIYIKIMMGLPNSSTICISFHIAEHKMNYPFK